MLVYSVQEQLLIIISRLEASDKMSAGESKSSFKIMSDMVGEEGPCDLVAATGAIECE